MPQKVKAIASILIKQCVLTRLGPACGYASFHQSVQSLDQVEPLTMPSYVSPRVSVRRSANLNSKKTSLNLQLDKPIKRRALTTGAVKHSPLRSKGWVITPISRVGFVINQTNCYSFTTLKLDWPWKSWRLGSADLWHQSMIYSFQFVIHLLGNIQILIWISGFGGLFLDVGAPAQCNALHFLVKFRFIDIRNDLVTWALHFFKAQSKDWDQQLRMGSFWMNEWMNEWNCCWFNRFWWSFESRWSLLSLFRLISELHEAFFEFLKNS